MTNLRHCIVILSCYFSILGLLNGESPGLDQLLSRAYPYAVTRDVTYCSPNGIAQKLDIHAPETEGLRPAVVLIHGGGWGGRDKSHKNFQEMADMYARRGFVVFNVNYRLSKTAPAPAAVQDVHCAARYIAAHAKQYKVDLDRIVATGNSAGCHLALMLAMCRSDLCTGKSEGEWEDYSPAVRAVINRFGITDAFERTFVGKGRRSAVKWFTGVEGDPKELAKRMSPVNYTNQEALPPIFTIHGDADINTPVSQGKRLHAGLVKAGHVSKLKIIPGGNHGLHNVGKQMDEEIERESFEFLLTHGLLG